MFSGTSYVTIFIPLNDLSRNQFRVFLVKLCSEYGLSNNILLSHSDFGKRLASRKTSISVGFADVRQRSVGLFPCLVFFHQIGPVTVGGSTLGSLSLLFNSSQVILSLFVLQTGKKARTVFLVYGYGRTIWNGDSLLRFLSTLKWSSPMFDS